MAATTSVSYSALEDALLWISDDSSYNQRAFVSRRTGMVHWTGGDWQDEDNPPPDDIDDMTLYASVPTRK